MLWPALQSIILLLLLLLPPLLLGPHARRAVHLHRLPRPTATINAAAFGTVLPLLLLLRALQLHDVRHQPHLLDGGQLPQALLLPVHLAYMRR